MSQTTDQLLEWLAEQLPLIRARLAVTYAAIDQARRTLAGTR